MISVFWVTLEGTVQLFAEPLLHVKKQTSSEPQTDLKTFSVWKANKKEVIEVSLIMVGQQKAERAFLLSPAFNRGT